MIFKEMHIGGKFVQYFAKTLTALLMIAFIYAALNFIYPRESVRYKLTVLVETPDGFRTGSAVREFTASYAPQITPETKPRISEKGEAVVIDMGNRGVAFVVMDRNEALSFMQAFPIAEGGITREGIKRYTEMNNVKTSLDLKQRPLIVRFRDLKDPKTVEIVYKTDSDAGYVDNFERFFGKGVRLNYITIEITDAPVTTGKVGKYLPWLSEYYNQRLDGSRFGMANADNAVSNNLSSGNFRAGE